jgi:hypothetical protein
VRSGEVLRRIKEKKNTAHTIESRRSTGLVISWRMKCLLKHLIEEKIGGRIDVKGRRERRRKQLLDKLKEKRGYCELKEKVLQSVCNIHF